MAVSPGLPPPHRRRLRQARRVLLNGGLGRGLAMASARSSGRALRRMLLVSDGSAFTSEQQFAPMMRHAVAVARRTGIVFSFVDPRSAMDLTPEEMSRYDAVGLKLTFQTPRDEARRVAQEILGGARKAGARTLVFDGDDDLSVLWPELLDASDAYIKKHRFRDRDAYGVERVGKSNLTDYAHRTYGVSFADDIIPVSGGLSPGQADKIVVGWNIALDTKIAELAQDIPSAATTGTRDIDVLCRASVPPSMWTFGMRDAAVRAVVALGDVCTPHAPTDRVPQAAYYDEMLRARLCVSPFGFGELCWRDFEAILSGCLLVKPDMGHVTTEPDLFVPGETYVPVDWDYGNLREACRPYLEDETLRRRVAETARRKLLAALEPAWLVDRFETTMRAAGVLK